jgi:hypothetical protein
MNRAQIHQKNQIILPVINVGDNVGSIVGLNVGAYVISVGEFVGDIVGSSVIYVGDTVGDYVQKRSELGRVRVVGKFRVHESHTIERFADCTHLCRFLRD